MAYPEKQYHRQETAKEYTKQYNLEQIDSVITRQEDGLLGYISAGQFATTGSNIFTSNQIINGNLDVNGNINVSTIISASIIYQSGSTKFGDSFDDTHTFTGSVSTTGQSEFGGNLVPKVPQGATLGTVERPFRELFLQSGSISIESDTVGEPPAIISNKNANLQVSIGGMKLVQSGSSFISPTGSFDYVSVMGSVNLTGSLYVNGNKQFNYGQFSDTTTQSGSANTVYSMKLNTTDFATGFSIVSGSRITAQNTGIYNLQFSAQLENTANTNTTIDIWLSYTGSNVANSAGSIDINKVAGQLGRNIAAWNYLVPMTANDYVELKWSSNASTTQILAASTQTNPTRPAIPSVIATMTQIA